MKRRFWRLPSVGNQTGDEIDEKVGDAAVAGVFNLGDILELVNDGLDMVSIMKRLRVSSLFWRKTSRLRMFLRSGVISCSPCA